MGQASSPGVASFFSPSPSRATVTVATPGRSNVWTSVGAATSVDAVVLEGHSAVDESMITGEPVPVDYLDERNFAQAAAAKAATLLGKGFVELDPYVAEVDAKMCSGHGNCKAVCPVEGAVTMADKVTRINPALCTGCGICVAECPAGAITLKHSTDDQVISKIDALLASLPYGGVNDVPLETLSQDQRPEQVCILVSRIEQEESLEVRVEGSVD